MINECQFRTDLIYPLSAFPIDHRRCVISPKTSACLVHHFETQYAARMRKRITAVSEEFMAVLMPHSWAGQRAGIAKSY
jgi:DNA-binding NtrC family response regulator